MRTSRIVIAIILAIVGLAWIGQGSGVIPGSAMSGSTFWAVVGVVLLGAAAVVLVTEARRRTS